MIKRYDKLLKGIKPFPLVQGEAGSSIDDTEIFRQGNVLTTNLGSVEYTGGHVHDSQVLGVHMIKGVWTWLAIYYLEV